MMNLTGKKDANAGLRQVIAPTGSDTADVILARAGAVLYIRPRHMRQHRLTWVRACAGMTVLVVLCMTMIGCDASSDSNAGHKTGKAKPTIVTSIPPIASLIKPLVAEWGEVESLLPAGATVHGYEPSAHQMHLAASADLLIVVGRNLDGWAQTLTKQAAGKRTVPVVTLARFIDGQSGLNKNVHVHHEDHADHDDHAHDHAGLNPHFWLDPILAQQFIQNILPDILALAPDDNARNATKLAADTLDQRLSQLNEQYQASLDKLKRKDMVTFHNAFDLLAARYGLRVAAHLTDVEIAPGGEVTASQLIDTIKTIRALKLKVLYAEPQFPDRATQVITQETGATILRLDPLGGQGLPGYSNYFEMMDSNLKTIIKGQSIP